MKNPNRRAEARRAAAGVSNGPDTLIIVNSRHGSALRYAEWISNALGTDMIPFNKRRLGYAALYQNIIYIGWVKNGSIEGLNLLQENHHNFGLHGKKIIVCAVGAAEPTKHYLSYIKKYNYIKGEFGKSFYYLPGQVNPDKINAADHGVFNAMNNGILKELPRSEAEELILRLTQGYNGIDMASVQPIVDEIKATRIVPEV
ncbi:MAG: hypothetical protein IJH75_00750 [Mogibacterium sp.]|nr:hypothetical protein [Mogibacterium sp.]